MDCDEIIVKNEPVCIDRPTRSFVKRQISKQQQSKTDASKTSSKQPKLSTKQFYFIYYLIYNGY
jgi:hypothetical protein